jgi:hypothetical protein
MALQIAIGPFFSYNLYPSWRHWKVNDVVNYRPTAAPSVRLGTDRLAQALGLGLTSGLAPDSSEVEHCRTKKAVTVMHW